MSLGIGLVESFSEFKEFKNIDRATMIRVMEDVFRSMLKRRYGDDSNFDVIVNDKTGDVEIYQRRLIVDEGEVESDISEISLSDARKMEPDFELNEEMTKLKNNILLHEKLNGIIDFDGFEITKIKF